MNTYTLENYITITKSIHILNKIYYDDMIYLINYQSAM